MDDITLLQSYIHERSEDAFRELVRRHLATVLAAASRQANGDAHLAQDVAQRVFISLARKARTLSRLRSIVGWLYTAARLEAARAVRSEVRRRRREEGAAALDLHEGSAISFNQLRPFLDDAMAHLGADEREAVLLRFFSGQSFAEIGRMLQVSEEAARKRVDRALDKLREFLGRRGVVSTASALVGALNTYAAPTVSPTVTTAIAAGACQQLASGSALSFGLFMTSTKAIAVTVAVLAVVGGVILSDYKSLRRLDEQRSVSRAELVAAEARQVQLVAELATVRHELAEAEKPPAAAPEAPHRSSNAAPAYLSDPSYRELARASTKARRHLEFQRLYRQLNLAPEQIERFEGIMVRQDEAKLDAALVGANAEDEQTVYRRSGSEWSEAMGALLGQDGFTQLQDYLRSMPVRAFIDNFAVQTSAISEALSPEQSDQLAALVLANDVMYQRGKGTDPGTVNWNLVWDPAAKLLSDEQLVFLQRMVETWSLQKQMSLSFK